MNFEELEAGVRKHHGAFVARIEGRKLLQVGAASRGAFAEWFRRQGRMVDVDGNDKDYDTAYSQGLLDGMAEKDVEKLTKKVLKQASAFVFSVPTSLWRYANVRRTAADYERILSAYEVEAFPYWGGKMLCVVAKKAGPSKMELAQAEPVEEKPVETEVAKTVVIKTEPVEEKVDFLEWETE